MAQCILSRLPCYLIGSSLRTLHVDNYRPARSPAKGHHPGSVWSCNWTAETAQVSEATISPEQVSIRATIARVNMVEVEEVSRVYILSPLSRAARVPPA